MNKKSLNELIKYFFKAILIGFIPAMAVGVILWEIKAPEFVIWLVCGIILFVVMLLASKKRNEKNQNKSANQNKKGRDFDPFAD